MKHTVYARTTSSRALKAGARNLCRSALIGLVAFGASLSFLSAPSLGSSSSETVSSKLEALGNNAVIYRLHRLDADGNTIADDRTHARSLALEVSYPNATSEWLMVPGTDDYTEEKTPALTFSQTTNTLLIVWEDQLNLLHSKIRITGFKEQEGFFDLLDLLGNPFYPKLRPQVLETTDSANWVETHEDTEGVETSTVITHRQVSQRVLHAAWREEQGHVFYSALVEGSDGAVAATQTIDLSAQLSELSDSWDTGVDGTLNLVHGKDGRTALMQFIDPLQRSLETIEISSLPIEFSVLSDAAYDAILASDDPNADLVAISEEARSHIVFIGRHFLSPTTTDVLSSAAARSVLESPDQLSHNGLVGVAQNARSHIVFIGRSLGVDQAANLDESALLLPIALSDSADSEQMELGSQPVTREPTVNLIVDHQSSRPLPEDVPSDAGILVSDDGNRVLLYWQSDADDTSSAASLSFCESTSEGWTETFRLDADRAGSIAAAEQLLRSRFSSAR